MIFIIYRPQRFQFPPFLVIVRRTNGQQREERHCEQREDASYADHSYGCVLPTAVFVFLEGETGEAQPKKTQAAEPQQPEQYSQPVYGAAGMSFGVCRPKEHANRRVTDRNFNGATAFRRIWLVRKRYSLTHWHERSDQRLVTGGGAVGSRKRGIKYEITEETLKE